MTIAIVGGGISGLALAHGLAARGQSVRLFERSERVGGQIRSHTESGFSTEDGPNTLLDREPSVRVLVETLGLPDRVVHASPAARRRYVWSRGRLWRLGPKTLFFSRFLSWKGRLRLLAEPFTSRPREWTDESLGAFARRHVGVEATELLVDAAQTGVFAGDVEKLSVAAAFPTVAALAREHRSVVLGFLRNRKRPQKGPAVGKSGPFSFTGGLEALPRALAAALGGAVELGTAVTALRPAGAKWSLTLQRPSGQVEAVEVDRVVLTPHPDVSADLVRSFAPTLASELDGIRFAPVAMVHLGYAPGSGVAPDGFGFLVPAREGRLLLGAIHPSAVFPGRAPDGGALLSCIFGGARHPEVLERDDASLLALAQDELKALAGISAAPAFTRVVRWSRAIPQYEVGHLARLDRIDSACARWPGLTLSGFAYRGPGIADCIRNATELTDALVRAS